MQNRSTKPREAAQQFDMIKESVAEAFRAARKAKAGVFDDLLEIG
jgi:hypothetical protein